MELREMDPASKKSSHGPRARRHILAFRADTRAASASRKIHRGLAWESGNAGISLGEFLHCRVPVLIANRVGAGIVLVKMKVNKLLHTRYRVNDLERTIQFYKNILGLDEVRRHKSPRGSELVFLKAPQSEETIEICSFPASGPVQVQADLTHLAFEVDSLEAFGRHLAAHGMKYSDGPTMKPDGSGGFAFIDAPEGYEIELIQRAKQTSGGGY
jgi:lactoylglutathione lyase